MKWLDNIKVGVKILTGFILVAIIAGVIGYIGIKNIKQIVNRDTMLYKNMTVPISNLSNISTSFQLTRVNLRDAIFAKTPEEVDASAEEIEKLRAEVSKNSQEFEKLILSQEVRDAYDQFIETRKAYADAMEQVLTLARVNKDQEALAVLYGSGKAAADAERDAINKLIQMKVNHAKEFSDTNTITANGATRNMIVILCIGVALGLVLGIIISRSIVKPVYTLRAELETLAERGGDLTQEINDNGKDEIGDLARAVNKFIANLRLIMIEVSNSAKNVAETSMHLNSTSQQTSASANETAATMGEISTTVEQVTANIQEISVASETATQHANEGNKGIVTVTEQMQKINGVSKETTDVIAGLNKKSMEIN